MFIEQTLTPQSALVPPTNEYQRGRTAIVSGQQQYSIALSPVFSSVPVLVRAKVLLASSSGEGFEVWPDLSTFAVGGFDLWLSGVPSASAGYIEWEAEI